MLYWDRARAVASFEAERTADAKAGGLKELDGF